MQYVLDHEDKRAYLKVVAGWEDGGGDSRVFPFLVPCTPGLLPRSMVPAAVFFFCCEVLRNVA